MDSELETLTPTPFPGFPRIPDDILCSITHQIMADPVILVGSGHTYEREAIASWLLKHDTDPLTNEKLPDATSKSLTPNRAAKSRIMKFLEKRLKSSPELLEEKYLPLLFVEQLLKAVSDNQSKAAISLLGQDSRLLTTELKGTKNMLQIVCECGPLELLQHVVKELDGKLKTMPGIASDNGFEQFCVVGRRLGVPASQFLAKALDWQCTDFEKSLVTLIEANDQAMTETCLKCSSYETTLIDKLLLQCYTAENRTKTELIKTLILHGSPCLQTEDSEGNDFFLRTVQDNYLEITEFLVTKCCPPAVAGGEKDESVQNVPGINLEKTNSKNQNSILIAYERYKQEGKYEIQDFNLLKFLIQIPNQKSKLNNLLIFAIENREIELIKFLLSNESLKFQHEELNNCGFEAMV